jgi:hypothetical protein
VVPPHFTAACRYNRAAVSGLLTGAGRRGFRRRAILPRAPECLHRHWRPPSHPRRLSALQPNPATSLHRHLYTPRISNPPSPCQTLQAAPNTDPNPPVSLKTPTHPCHPQLTLVILNEVKDQRPKITRPNGTPTLSQQDTSLQLLYGAQSQLTTPYCTSTTTSVCSLPLFPAQTSAT